VSIVIIKTFAHKIIALTLVSLLIVISGCSQQTNRLLLETEGSERPIPETEFTVSGDFLHFYNIYGGESSLGVPISEEMVEAGWRVQYFEYGRLEYHPENEADYRVTVGWLGDLLNRRRPPLPPSAIPADTDSGHRYYPKTGHTLSGDFMTYFDSNGGSVRFGLPISEPFLIEGQITQDFQSARFIWTPQATSPVQLETIGLTHLTVISPPHKIKTL
jgi:hypothetical protein